MKTEAVDFFFFFFEVGEVWGLADRGGRGCGRHGGSGSGCGRKNGEGIED